LNRQSLTTLVRSLANDAKTPSNQSSSQKPTAAASQQGGSYQATEYYGYNVYSFFDIEKEMMQYRQPQPTSLPKIDFSWSTCPPKPADLEKLKSKK
jgi:hypothetical protein